jgi:hypothetical protein
MASKGDQAPLSGFSYLPLAPPAGERLTTADDDEPLLSHTAKLIIAVAVFALGVPIGAAIAAWVMPPS